MPPSFQELQFIKPEVWGGGIPPSFQHFTSFKNSNLERNVRRETRKWCELQPFLGAWSIRHFAKKGWSFHFRRPFSLVRFFLDEQKEMNFYNKKEGVPLRNPLLFTLLPPRGDKQCYLWNLARNLELMPFYTFLIVIAHYHFFAWGKIFLNISSKI